MELDVVCPSGLAGRIRGWKTKEANILANRKNARAGLSFDSILQSCWLSTTDQGIYTFEGKPDWRDVLLCDRFWVLLRMRAATYGDEYEFDVQCQDRQICGKKIPWECNLSELPFSRLPEESREKIRAGDNRFGAQVMIGDESHTIYFHLQTGKHERKAAKLVEGQDTRLVVAALAARIDEVEGVPKGGLVHFLDELDMGDLMRLLDEFDAADGGVDTTIEIECPHCGLLQDVELPFDRGFFMPRRHRRSMKKSPLESL
jgi:hypothetical protein